MITAQTLSTERERRTTNDVKALTAKVKYEAFVSKRRFNCNIRMRRHDWISLPGLLISHNFHAVPAPIEQNL